MQGVINDISYERTRSKMLKIEEKYLRIKEVSNEIYRLQAIYFKNRTDKEDMKLEQLINTLNMLKGE